ncbi:hypothetical protein D3C74_417890 [compost metagenome]
MVGDDLLRGTELVLTVRERATELFSLLACRDDRGALCRGDDGPRRQRLDLRRRLAGHGSTGGQDELIAERQGLGTHPVDDLLGQQRGVDVDLGRQRIGGGHPCGGDDDAGVGEQVLEGVPGDEPDMGLVEQSEGRVVPAPLQQPKS